MGQVIETIGLKLREKKEAISKAREVLTKPYVVKALGKSNIELLLKIVNDYEELLRRLVNMYVS